MKPVWYLGDFLAGVGGFPEDCIPVKQPHCKCLVTAFVFLQMWF